MNKKMKTTFISVLMLCITWFDATATDLKVRCQDPGPWRIVTEKAGAAEIEEFVIRLTSSTTAVPPRFDISFDVPQLDAHHKWTTQMEKVTMPPNWGGAMTSRLCQSLPLVSFVNDADQNRILVVVSEAKRTVRIDAGLREEDCCIVFALSFFTEPEVPISDYEVRIRIDRREVFFGDAIREGSAWIERTAGLRPAEPPAAAFDPLYSSWYSFHQDVTDTAIEAECAEAAKLGMKVLIVDDGWQTDDNNRGYAYTGDWELSKRRFPDMAEHVRRVHALGMKYMVWYGVPMMGFKAKNYGRFKGKFLWEEHGSWSDYACLDPRFPEVRDYICSFYERAMREWGLDGLKLDFIDSFGFRGEDPAVREDYAGRDLKSLPEAVDRLLAEIFARIRMIRPEALVEFRQGYIGPAVRHYGNMMRAGDCPGDLLANRCRTANLRLTSGKSAVHSDMLEWNAAETPENAARFVLASIFSTIQYSVMLRTLPASHKRMIRHWLEFSQRHRSALLKGEFRPHHFEAMYPWIEAEDVVEKIVAVYTAGIVAELGTVDKPIFVLNATGAGEILVRVASVAECEVFDTFGCRHGVARLSVGINAVHIPVSGYLQLFAAK